MRTRPVNQSAGPAAEGCQRLDRVPLGDIDRGCAHGKPSVGEDLCCGVRCLLAKVCQQHMFSGAHPAGDGDADRTGADDDNNLVHGRTITFSASRAFIAL
jgi:hypothetical protein